MSRFDCLAIFFVCCSVQSLGLQAQAKVTEADAKTAAVAPNPPPTNVFRPISYVTLSISYFSWQERVSLSNGALSDKANSSLLGNALGLEWEHYFKQRQGISLQGSFLYGVADVGGTQTAVSYNLVNQNWWGAGITTQYCYRFSKYVVAEAGPIIIYRSLTLPVDPSGTTAVSGAMINFGATIAMKLRLSERLEIREDTGLLAVNASTYWSVNLGYMF